MSQSPHAVNPFAAGIACRCPRCGEGRLYTSSFGLDVAEACGDCGMQYRFVDTGDSPAVFATMILGLLILGAALLVEFRLHPPWWLHVIIWGPATLFVALGLLRPLKALMIALQYHNKAEQGRLDGE